MSEELLSRESQSAYSDVLGLSCLFIQREKLLTDALLEVCLVIFLVDWTAGQDSQMVPILMDLVHQKNAMHHTMMIMR